MKWLIQRQKTTEIFTWSNSGSKWLLNLLYQLLKSVLRYHLFLAASLLKYQLLIGVPVVKAPYICIYVQRILPQVLWKSFISHSQQQMCSEDTVNTESTLDRSSYFGTIWTPELASVPFRDWNNSFNLSQYKGILWCMGPISIPDTNGSFLRASARGSIARAKSKGETGQPCLQPRRTTKEGDLILLVITDAYGAA